MARELLIDALGTCVRIDLAGLSDHDAAAVAEAWRDATVEPDEVGAGPVVAWGAPPREWPIVTPLDTDDAAERLADLSQRVTLAAIDAQKGTRWMLHAAGLASDDGRVVVLVGPSGRGKTTAARTLGAHLGYVSDETIAIEANGRVHAYRKPLSIIEGEAGPKVQRSPSQVGLRPLPDAELRVAAIVLLDRRDVDPATDPDVDLATDRRNVDPATAPYAATDPDAGSDAREDPPDGTPTIEHVDLADALGEIVTQSSYLTAMHAPLQDMAALAAATGGIRRVVYREASDLLPTIEAILAGSTFDDGARPPAPRVPGAATLDRKPGWFRTRPHDVLFFDDPECIAVLIAGDGGEGAVRVLAGVAPAIWRAAAGASLAELVDAAVAAHGAPEGQDAAALVDAAVQSLAAEGVLEWREGRWGIRDDVAWTGGEGRVVALSLADFTAPPQALEGSGASIWTAVAEGDATTGGVIARVAASVGVEPAQISDDVESFLIQLHEAQLLDLR